MFWKRVNLKEPDGRIVPVEFRFKRFRRRELSDLFERFDENLSDPNEAFQRDVDMVLEIAVDWRRSPVDGDFNRDNVEELLDLFPSAAIAIVQAFHQAHLDVAEKKR